MAEMKNLCGKIPVELHEKVRAEIEEKETSTQIFIQQVIEEHFNRLEGKGEESMEKRTLAVQITEELFQRVKWAVYRRRRVFRSESIPSESGGKYRMSEISLPFS